MYRVDRADKGSVLISLLLLVALLWERHSRGWSWGLGGGRCESWTVIIGPPGTAGPGITPRPGP